MANDRKNDRQTADNAPASVSIFSSEVDKRLLGWGFSLWGFVVQVIAITAMFAGYETIKELSHPELTKWQSHSLSIVMVCLVSAAVIYRFRSLLQAKAHLIAHEPDAAGAGA